MPTETVVYDTFANGEYGLLEASGAPPGSFTGRNVMVYQDGTIGPRPGLIRITPASTPVGQVWGIGAIGRTLARGVAFGIGNTVYGFTYSPLGAATSLGTLAGTPATVPVQLIPFTTFLYAVVKGDKGYKIDPVGTAVTALASMPAAQVIGLYGERMIVANVASNPNRVYYSAAADFTSWPALNYFDVSTSWAVSHVSEARSRLAIANQGNEWWALSGVPGVNDTLRRSPRSDLSPFSFNHVARIGESLFFLPCNEDFPAQFTGAVTDKLRYRFLAFAGGAGVAGETSGAASLPSSETVLFTEGTLGRMLVQCNGVWTVHTVPVNLGPYVTAVAQGGIGVNNGVFILCDGGAVGVAPKFYVWDPMLDRPGKVSDTEAQPGDDSTTPVAANFALPEHWARGATEVSVRKVTVDFKKWNTGSASTNHFDLTVRALYRTGVSAHKDSKVQDFDESPTVTTADATVDRRTLTFGDQGHAHGYQLRFDNVRGVAIRRIVVEADVLPVRGG